MPPKKANQPGVVKILTEEQKKTLAREVQKYPSLWAISEEGYMKRDVGMRCWRAVSEEVQLTGWY